MKKGFFVSMIVLPVVAALAFFGVSKEEEEVSRQKQSETPETALAAPALPPEQKPQRPAATNQSPAKSQVILAKTENSSSDEQIKKAVESVLKNGPEIEHAWKKYRLELYTNAGLTRQNIIDLDLLLNRYNDRQQELQDKYNGATPEEQKAIALQMDESFKQMDQEVEAFLGPKRFNYIKEARAKFTRDYNKQNKTHIETTAW